METSLPSLRLSGVALARRKRVGPASAAAAPPLLHHLGCDRLKRALPLLLEAARIEGDGRVEDATLPLHGFAERELPARLRAPPLERVHRGVGGACADSHEDAARHLQMLHEEAANEVVRIPEPSRDATVGGEEQPSVLDRRRREHVLARANPDLLSLEGADAQPLDGADALVRLDLANGGVRVEVDVPRADDRVAVARAEARRRTELPHLRPHDRRVERKGHERRVAPLPLCGLVLVRSKLEHAMRAGVVRVEMGAREWPAAVRDPLTRREIDRIERRTETG